MFRISATSPAILRRNSERISLVRLLEWSRFLSLLSLSICVAVFFGFVFEITPLLRPLGNQSIHPVTALGAMLVALAALVSDRRDLGSTLLLRLLCSSVIVAMMARLLFEAASGSLYDRLVPDSLLTVLEPRPVVSGNSALCLLLLATSLLLRNVRDALAAQALAFLAFGFPALSLVGYLMGIGAFHGRMSLTTVLILIPLCASVMLSTVRSGFLRRLLGNSRISVLARAYLLLIMLLPYLVGFALLQFSSTYAGLPLAMLTVATSQLVGLCICFFVLSSANIEVSGQAAMRLARSRSHRDGLTGALNRGHFADCAVRIIDQRRAAEDALSLLFIDIDHFKRVNDTHGHAAGDAVLQRAYSLMRECLRHDDIIARWGGEEFVVLLPGVEIRGAQRLAETLRRRVAEQAIRHDAQELCITISVGCAQVERHESLDQLIARADKALYRAKDLGRNRIAVG